jgi:exonuclease SbcC
MIPVSLTLSGFLSYRDPVTLDFTGFDLACIAGSNGAGKSSLLDAITYALFGGARQKDDSLINLHHDVKQAFVELVFDYEGNRYRVQRTKPRGKTTVLEFQIAQPGGGWKPLTERAVRDTDARIQETLRLDYDTFTNASFFLQGKADQFTQQRPARRKEILAGILGLETWETYRQRAAARRKEVETDITTLDGRLAEINTELAEEDDRRQRLHTLQADLERLETVRNNAESSLRTMQKIQAQIDEQQRSVDSLARQVHNSQQRVADLELRETHRTRERDACTQSLSRAPEIRAQYQSLQKSRAELTAWDATAGQFREHEKRRQTPITEIEKERARLETERASLLAQRATRDHTASQMANLQSQIASLQTTLAETETQLSQKSLLETELTAARDRQSAARVQNPTLKAEMDDLRARIDQLEAAPPGTSVCPLCSQPLTPQHRAELISQLTAQGTEKGDQYRSNKKLLEEADELVRSLQGQISALQPLDTAQRARLAELAAAQERLDSLGAAAAEWESTLAPRLAEIETALANETFAAAARAALAGIDAELKATGYDPAVHDRIRRAVEAGASIEEELRTLDKAEAALEPLQRELADIRLQIDTYRAELAELTAAHDSAAVSLAAALADAPDLAAAQQELLKLREQENQLRGELGGAQQRVAVLVNLREHRAALETERAALAGRVAHYKQLERAFGKDGVPALLIEQALPQIEAKANELLERLSGGEMAVRFLTQRELKTRDDLRETLDITISDPAGTRAYEMYSGGEAFRVNFAIRLALSEVLAQRAGARLQTLVIDEGFGSQDAAGRQRLIEAINMIKDDFAKILVITHIDELKDAFPTRIEVEKGARGSEVRVV